MSTSNQKALVWNLAMSNPSASIEHVLHAHTRAITDINFSAHHPDLLATCAVDSFVHCWDLRFPARPAITFCDWFAGATQVKWNRQEGHIIASSHDKMLRIWDDRKGAYPLRSIVAHDTKIYGIDWNRTDARSLATCSLDCTIKFWNYENPTELPHSVIRTPFPVWRARHTPFGHGMLAMPQRGDFNVHLYDRRPANPTERGTTDSLKKFTGHENQVKEFLWRSRGHFEDGLDDREFQLVTWGTDLSLRLHRMTEDDVEQVGFVKGAPMDKNIAMTRRNAQYRTFQEDPRKDPDSPSHNAVTSDDPFSTTSIGFDYHRPSLGTIVPSPSTALGGWMSAGFINTRSGMASKKAARKELAPISWMKGVKIGKREGNVEQSMASITSPELKTHRGSEEFESLGEEITHVGSKFSKVDFSHVDIQKRNVRLSMHGPWAENHAMTYLNCQVKFPDAYPHGASPTISIEKTASLAVSTVAKLQDDANKIGLAYQTHNRSSFEAQIRYLQGEQTLEDIVAWTKDDADASVFDYGSDNDASSSDDEDELGTFVGKQDNEVGLTGSGVLSVSNANANVPLAQTCGASWSADGRLTCFFRAKEDLPTSLVGSLGLDDPASLSRLRRKGYEKFGRFYPHSSVGRSKTSSFGTIESDDSDSDVGSDSSDLSSSSSLSGRDLDSGGHHSGLQSSFRMDMFPFQRGTKFTDDTQRSTASLSVTRSGNGILKSSLIIHGLTELLPSKPTLAFEYTMEGPGAFLLNSSVARKHGLNDLAEAWIVIDMILKNQVPLRAVALPNGWCDSQSLPVSLPLRRIDSGMKLNEPLESDQELKTSVKWGDHPFGQAFLIKQLFDHFANLADVQMLALMSCIFASSTPQAPVFGQAHDANELSLQKSARLLIPTILSSPSTGSPNRLEYFPSVEVAFSVLQPTSAKTIAVPTTQRRKLESVSLSSSLGAGDSEHQIALASSLTPPMSFRSARKSFDTHDSASMGMSSSPERLKWSYRSSSQSAAMLSSSFQRTFFPTSASSSPPNNTVKKKISPESSFGPTAVHTTPVPTPLQRQFSRSLSIAEQTQEKVAPSDRQRAADRRPQSRPFTYKISLKNQDCFYNDGYSDVPLLDLEDAQQHQLYRVQYAELLAAWGLFLERAAILKFNSGGSSQSVQQGTSASGVPIGKPKPGAVPSSTKQRTLQMRRACPQCGHASTPGWISGGSCVHCRAKPAPTLCVLCEEPIFGRASPCLACGHVLHAACRMAAAALRHGDGLLGQAADGRCISGCGCACDDFSPMPEHMMEPVDPPSRAVSVTRRTSAGEGVVEHGEDPFEDVAYQSLKKNLGGLGKGRSRSWRGKSRSSSSVAT